MDPMMRVTRSQLNTVLATLMMLAPVGCASFSGGKPGSSAKSEKKSLLARMPWSKDKAPEPYPAPVKIAATWTPDTLVQSGHTPTRGFGGRLFFYDEKSRPVPVEGTLVVHGVDEAAESKQDGVKRFEFTPEQFTKHFSHSDLGASYSVWLPWDAVGGDQKRISIVASFVNSEGRTIQCTPSVVVLPGRTQEPTEADALAKLSPQYREHLNALASANGPTSGLMTTTIQRRQRSGSGMQTKETSPGFGGEGPTRIAAKSTPAFDLPMARRPAASPSTVLPASAELPTEDGGYQSFQR